MQVQDKELRLIPDRNLQEAVVLGNYLKLPLPPQKMIYHLCLDVTNLAILESLFHPVRDDVLPDATISGAVEFVESEARYYQKTHSSKPSPE
jgi:hypothetical protein